MGIQKKNKKKGYIILLLIGLLILWRYSYFIFVPDVYSKFETVYKKDLPANIITGLLIESDTIPDNDPDGQSIAESPFKEDHLKQVTVEQNPDIFGMADINIVTSSEFGWKRKFSDYYGAGGIVASSNKYWIVQLDRQSDFRVDDLNVLSGSSGASPLIYIFYNTSKIGYRDIYFLDRKTGATAKQFRFQGGLRSAFYSDNTFYFRFGDKDVYYRYME